MSTPGVKEEAADEDAQALQGDEATLFRAVAARSKYLSQDRPELLYAAKEACRSMASPTLGAMKKAKRIGGYLAGRPRSVQVFEHQELPHKLRVYCDSDWAACRTTRRSTSGGCVQLGAHVLRSWSTTQSVTALSSGEAEYYAMLKGTSLGSGIQAMADDLALFFDVVLYTDSAVATGIAQRRGLGKTCHIQVAHLWLQEKVHRKELGLRKVAAAANPADLMTKHLVEAAMLAHMDRMNSEVRQGRHEIMPEVNSVLAQVARRVPAEAFGDQKENDAVPHRLPPKGSAVNSRCVLRENQGRAWLEKQPREKASVTRLWAQP